jgi:hypothetical protein
MPAIRNATINTAMLPQRRRFDGSPRKQMPAIANPAELAAPKPFEEPVGMSMAEIGAVVVIVRVVVP